MTLPPMKPTGSTLTEKAVLALEEVVQDCRFCVPPRTRAVRLALAYLWSRKRGDREPFETFWASIARTDAHRHLFADRALDDICNSVGIARSDDAMMEIWRERFEFARPDEALRNAHREGANGGAP